jgi:hypothetical protein
MDAIQLLEHKIEHNKSAIIFIRDEIGDLEKLITEKHAKIAEVEGWIAEWSRAATILRNSGEMK